MHPGQHGIFGGDGTPSAADLVVADQSPNESQNELQVAIEYISRPYVQSNYLVSWQLFS